MPNPGNKTKQNPFVLGIYLSESSLKDDFEFTGVFAEDRLADFFPENKIKIILGFQKDLKLNFPLPSNCSRLDVDSEWDFLEQLALEFESFSPDDYFNKNFEVWEKGILSDELLKENQKKLREELPIILYYKEMPLFFFPELLSQLLKNHIQLVADISFYDNSPAGVSPLVIAPWFLNDNFTDRTSLFWNEKQRIDFKAFCLKNLNKIEAELEYLEPDITNLRLDFSYAGENPEVVKNKIQNSLNKNVNKSNLPSLNYRDMAASILENGDVVRNLPHYFEIEITNECKLSCTYCPRAFVKNNRSEMTLEFFEKLIKQILSIKTKNKVLCFGGLGEPLEHSQFLDFVSLCSQYTKEDTSEPTRNFKNIYLETNATLLNRELAIKLINSFKNKLVVIINLNTLNKDKYSQTQGAELHTVLENIESFKEELIAAKLDPLKQLVIQILKTKDTENEIDTIVKYFKEKSISVLIQKYNRYKKLMAEKRVSDLTPLNRSFCWHLARDMFILADGTLAFCKQDITNSNTKIDLNKMDLLEAWNKSENDFQKNYNGELSKTHDCENCDEWFTFNA